MGREIAVSNSIATSHMWLLVSKFVAILEILKLPIMPGIEHPYTFSSEAWHPKMEMWLARNSYWTPLT